MNVSLYQAAAAMNANERWQEVISENLAAGSLTAFKKQEVSFTAIQAGLMPHSNLSRPGAALAYALPGVTTSTNFSGGELRPTGVNTHLALEGPGFFEVQLPSGATAYTRDGQFQLDLQGQLVNGQGFPVLGEKGPIQLNPRNREDVSISPTGEVRQGGEVKGTLKLSDFQNPNLLTPVGGGLYEARDPRLTPAAGAKPKINPGCLEGSNTSSPAEMGNLITSMRAFEANQRVVQLHDERMGRIITELGNPS